MQKLKPVLIAILLALLYLAILESRLFGLGPAPYVAGSPAAFGRVFLLWQLLIAGAASALLVLAALLFRTRVSPLLALLVALPAAIPHVTILFMAVAMDSAALVYAAFMLIVVGGTPPLLFWLSNKQFQPTNSRYARIRG